MKLNLLLSFTELQLCLHSFSITSWRLLCQRLTPALGVLKSSEEVIQNTFLFTFSFFLEIPLHFLHFVLPQK